MDARISLRINAELDVDGIIALYRDSGLNRPVDDRDRIAEMYKGANLVVSAHDGEQLVGICRALTDHQYVCYVADLAVRREHQKRGIGRALMERLAAMQGERVALVLLSAPGAMAVYPRLGFALADNCFVRRRSA